MGYFRYSPARIKKHFDDNAIGQNQAKIKLAIAINNHFLRVEPDRPRPDIHIEKSNVLVIGPSGCGKTYLVKLGADYVDVPFLHADASRLTQSGYVGQSVESLILGLYRASGNNVSKTEKGIIYLDEVDKIKATVGGSGPDVRGTGVQQELLTLVAGTVVTLSLGKDPLGNEMQEQIDTTDILFIFSGAFVGLEELIAKRLQVNTRSSIGFNARIFTAEELKEAERERLELFRQVEDIDLINFGFLTELVGRIQIRTCVQQLAESELRRILTEPKNSLVKQQTSLLFDDIDLTFSMAALDAIAAEAAKSNTGARALSRILEEVLSPSKFELPRRITITSEMVSYRHQAMLNLEAGEPAYSAAMLKKREKLFVPKSSFSTIKPQVALAAEVNG